MEQHDAMQASEQMCGWAGTVGAFLVTDQESWLSALSGHHERRLLETPSSAQLIAWRHCYDIMRAQLAQLIGLRAEARQWAVVFEYELPRERGRRPDVVILAGARNIVLEFKDFATVLPAHCDQVAAYARDLQHYHAASHDSAVLPVLVPTLFPGPYEERNGVLIVPPASLASVLDELVPQPDAPQLATSLDAWLAADYAPLPSLVAAARTIFQREPLPHIRRAQSAGIDATIATLVGIAEHARQHSERHLALVTGVPGAGKTLVGLQFVYQTHIGAKDTNGRSAVFLSGNGPLVNVLQHALKSSIFVQGVHGFLKQYGGAQQRMPDEHIWVYDEAQRAWDAERVRLMRRHGASEPEDFLRLGARMDEWALMVGLIGEGQEIYLGEEAGLVQWNAALATMEQPWTVHCPAKVAHLFTATTAVEANDWLDLTISLRSHLAADVQRWVQALLNGNLAHAAHLSQGVREQGFTLYITRDLDVAKAYVRERYAGHEDKRYGLLASSEANNVRSFGVRNKFSDTKDLRQRAGPWYNDLPTSPASCCQLREVATEFICQGLELDFPIVVWGDDLTWHSDRWESSSQQKAHDPHRLRVNSYRVLLSRGRDGLVVFVPSIQDMDATYAALTGAGLLPLTAVQ